jgi:hypothetical protein
MRPRNALLPTRALGHRGVHGMTTIRGTGDPLADRLDQGPLTPKGLGACVTLASSSSHQVAANLFRYFEPTGLRFADSMANSGTEIAPKSLI